VNSRKWLRTTVFVKYIIIGPGSRMKTQIITLSSIMDLKRSFSQVLNSIIAMEDELMLISLNSKSKIKFNYL
jgi:hypothetical protein